MKIEIDFLKVSLIGLACLILASLLFTCKPEPISPIVHPIASSIPKISINLPTSTIKEKIAEGNVSVAPGTIRISGNTQKIKLIANPAKISGSGAVVVEPDNTASGPSIFSIDKPEATIELPSQQVNIHIEREKSPFKLNVQAYPEPALGLGYNAVTINLDKPLGLNANLGNLSVGPYVNKSITNGNTYVGVEATKSLGRVNLDLGYGLNVMDGTHSVSGGLSVNFN